MTSTNEEVVSYFTQMAQESGAIEKQVFEICWYMRGGVTLNEAYNLSPGEREIVSALVKENLETTKKSGQPFF